MHPAELAATPNAMDRAIAKIEAMGAAWRDRDARIAADHRIARIKALEPTGPEFEHGSVGARQLFGWLASGNAVRSARIASLVQVRIGQLDGNRAAVRRNLADARSARLQETLTVRAEGVDHFTVVEAA